MLMRRRRGIDYRIMHHMRGSVGVDEFAYGALGESNNDDGEVTGLLLSLSFMLYDRDDSSKVCGRSANDFPKASSRVRRVSEDFRGT